MPTMKELLNKAKFVAGRYSNGGYSTEQEKEKEFVKKMVLESLKTAFPDISNELGVKDYRGLGYYSSYSDFAITYNGEKLLGIGTHTATVQRKSYTVEYDFDVLDIKNKENLDSLSPAMVVFYIKEAKQEELKNTILKKIEEKEKDIKKLKSDLNKLNNDDMVKSIKINFFTWSYYGPQGSMLIEGNNFSKGEYIDTYKDVNNIIREGIYVEDGKVMVHKDYKFSPLTCVEFAFKDDDNAVYRLPFALSDIRTKSFIDQFEKFGDRIDNTVVGLGLRNQFEECIKVLKTLEYTMDTKDKVQGREIKNLTPDENIKENKRTRI